MVSDTIVSCSFFLSLNLRSVRHKIKSIAEATQEQSRPNCKKSTPCRSKMFLFSERLPNALSASGAFLENLDILQWVSDAKPCSQSSGLGAWIQLRDMKLILWEQ
ncbi:hypothetical protein AV530_010953 [Patagioenas fasciata monilis]|nr:hypothetical protein AV530_010953 [Patagioenas fasciata monilis]